MVVKINSVFFYCKITRKSILFELFILFVFHTEKNDRKIQSYSHSTPTISAPSSVTPLLPKYEEKVLPHHAETVASWGQSRMLVSLPVHLNPLIANGVPTGGQNVQGAPWNSM